MSSKSKHRPPNKPPEGKLEKLPTTSEPVPVVFADTELAWLERVLSQVQVSGDGVLLCYRLREKVAYMRQQARSAPPAAPEPAPASAPAPAPAQEPPAAATA